MFKRKALSLSEIANSVLSEKQNKICDLCKSAGHKCKSKTFCLPSEILADLLYEDKEKRIESLENMEMNLEVTP
jgi:hypothetical protein